MVQPSTKAGLSILVLTLGALALGLAALAQNLPQPLDPGKTYPLAGTVVDSLTGRPISRALVSSPNSGRAVLTGPQGDFSLGSAPAGTVEITVRKPGYFRPGLRPSGNAPYQAENVVERVAVGPDTGSLVFRLAPEAVFAGTILGDDDEPLDRVQVDVFMVRTTIDGRREIVRESRTVTSDEDGHFHVAGLAAGRYYICARAARANRSVFSRPESGANIYPTLVYFPDSSDIAGATPFDLAAGQRQEVTFKLETGPAFKVSGVLADAREWKRVVTPQLVDELQRPILGADRFDSQTGAFEFRAVPAGTYRLQIGAINSDGRYSPIFHRIAVHSNIADLRISMQGFDVPILLRSELVHANSTRGHCTTTLDSGVVHESDCSDYPAARLELHSLDLTNLQFQSDYGPLTAGFGIHGVSPGVYTVRAATTFGGYVQSLRCGGADLMREPLVISEGGGVRPIEVVVRDDPASLNIHVRTDKPGEAVQVLVLPQPVTTAEPQVIRSAGDAYAGQLAPGDYKIFAFDAADDAGSLSPDALDKYAAQATVISISANETANVAVNLIHLDE